MSRVRKTAGIALAVVAAITLFGYWIFSTAVNAVGRAIVNLGDTEDDWDDWD